MRNFNVGYYLNEMGSKINIEFPQWVMEKIEVEDATSANALDQEVSARAYVLGENESTIMLIAGYLSRVGVLQEQFFNS